MVDEGDKWIRLTETRSLAACGARFIYPRYHHGSLSERSVGRYI